MIPIQKLLRSKRKTLALIIERDGSLTVRAPLAMSDAVVKRFVRDKANWIRRKQAQVLQDGLVVHRYIDGEMFFYLGQEYPLRLVTDQKPALVMNGEFELSQSTRSRAAALFITWYRQQARQVIGGRVEYFSHLYAFKPGKIRISSARTRWGSCSARGTLSFPWRLVMAPIGVVDYVVVHELCHLKTLNHSHAFWARVEKIMPDYKSRRKWLKENGGKLTL